MDDIRGSERQPVYHVPQPGTNGDGIYWRDAQTLAALFDGKPQPRLFVLVQDEDDDEAEGEGADFPTPQIVAYGIALPDGNATTVSPSGSEVGRWHSPETASSRTHSDLLWLAP